MLDEKKQKKEQAALAKAERKRQRERKELEKEEMARKKKEEQLEKKTMREDAGLKKAKPGVGSATPKVQVLHLMN